MEKKMKPKWISIASIAYDSGNVAGVISQVMNTPAGCVLQEGASTEHGETVSIVNIPGIWYHEQAQQWVENRESLQVDFDNNIKF